MSKFEKWMALFTLLGAIATAIGSFISAVKPKPPPPPAAESVLKTAAESECKTIAVVGSWWLMRCR